MVTSLVLAFSVATSVFSLPTGLIDAICLVESGHRNSALNPHDGGSPSLGVCQIKLATARQLGYKGTAYDLQHNEAINIHYAAKYLAAQLKRYSGDPRKAVAAYNAGTYRKGDTSFAKNPLYVQKVFKAWAELK